MALFLWGRDRKVSTSLALPFSANSRRSAFLPFYPFRAERALLIVVDDRTSSRKAWPRSRSYLCTLFSMVLQRNKMCSLSSFAPTCKLELGSSSPSTCSFFFFIPLFWCITQHSPRRPLMPPFLFFSSLLPWNPPKLRALSGMPPQSFFITFPRLVSSRLQADLPKEVILVISAPLSFRTHLFLSIICIAISFILSSHVFSHAYAMRGFLGARDELEPSDFLSPSTAIFNVGALAVRFKVE